MPDVFISYSRRNLEFVQQLVDALKMRGKDPWFDQLKEPLSGIVVGAPWWKEIQHGIENSDNFIFVISPNSISSPYCHAEINYAREHGKRLLPVLYCGWIGEGETRRAIDAVIEAIPDDEELPGSVTSRILNLKKLVRENWLAISEIQYVIFSSSIAFEQSLEQLIQALDLDLAWVRMHSQIVQAAKLWEASGFDDDFLWRANRLKPVYEMIERRSPELDTLVQEFIKPEQDQLLRELENPKTSHLRRREIGERLEVIGDTRSGVGLRSDGLPDIVWCSVPRGEIALEEPIRERGAIVGKEDLGIFPVEQFHIAKYPITYIQFQAFLNTPEGFENRVWWQDLDGECHEQVMKEQHFKFNNHPRETVTWYQAVAFCNWLNAKLPRDAWPSGTEANWLIRLPAEWEWQLAATGGDLNRLYPWGRRDDSRMNCQVSGIGRTTAVGMYPHGGSPVGALDMAGNVREWCLNEYKNPKNVSLCGKEQRVLRSGSWIDPIAICTDRYQLAPTSRGYAGGFRVCVGAALFSR